jgi:hypothetical protein
MRVDAAGHDVLAACIDHPSPGGRFEIEADALDHAIGAIDIRAEALIGRNDGAASDQY